MSVHDTITKAITLNGVNLEIADVNSVTLAGEVGFDCFCEGFDEAREQIINLILTNEGNTTTLLNDIRKLKVDE